MRVVVDLGCAEHPQAESLKVLAREYKPDHIYGFDPKASRRTKILGIPATLRRAAAWTYDGTIVFHEDGWASRIDDCGAFEVECVDFSAWLRTLEADEIIVKMDIEGAEFQVLQRMIEDGTDKRVSELLVEWHGAGQELEERLACPVRHWWL